MATILSIGDIAIVQYNTSTDAFSFVFLHDVEAGTTVNFTDDGWLAAGGFRPGEGTVTYAAPTAITAGTIVTLTGLNLDDAGDQIIAYQGDAASPTILHLVDFADGNNTVAGNATNDNTTALPPGFTLGVNAVAVAFDSSLYAGPTSGSPEGLFAALNNAANWLGGDALPVEFIANAKPTIDLDSNNSTHLGRDYETTVASGGPPVPVADIDVAIDDNDDFVIFKAEIFVNGKDPNDLLTVNGSLPAGIVETGYNPTTGLLRLEGQASHADYETAIRQVEFSTTDSPNQLKRVLVSVYDGTAWSQEGTAFIHVSARLPAVPPALDLDANNSSAGGADATATYTAGGPAQSVTDTDVAITDADSATIQSATITILGWALNPGDALSVAGALPGGITASGYDASAGAITLSGSASLADYQTALHQVVYSNTLSTPSTADRGIQVTVNDGALNSNAATMYMHVVVPPPNIAPVLDLDANNSTTPGANYLTGFTEGGPPVALADTDVSIFDSDSPNLASATITLTNPQTDDILTFQGTPPAGIAVSGSGTSVVTLTGAASSASYEAALQQIKFSNSNIDPSNITRIVEVVVNDGTSDSNTATAVVQVEAVNNSAPVIDLDPNHSGGSIRGTFHTNFTENGTPIPIADTDTTITDLDSTTLVSARITLANQHPGDLLTALPLPGSIAASSYDPATGVLTLTGVATLGEYETALQRVLYSNTSDNPATEDRLIEVVVNDGANASNVAATLIGVTAVNDAPVIQVDPLVTYLENAAAVTLSPLATLTDVDDTELNDLVVRITGGAIAGDGDTLTVGGLTSGTINGITFLWHPEDHALVFTGASLVANYQDLLRQVAFNSTSDNPTDFDASSARTLTWSVSGGIAVTTATTTLDIVAVNDAPQATVAPTASYTENGAPVVLSPAATVTDADDINLVAGEVRIVSGTVDGDLLTVGGLQSGTFSGIDFSYDAIRHSLTFTGPTTVADYQTFLQAIEFSSTSDNPTDSGLSPTRTLSWFVFDGDALSDVQTTVVSVTAVNDAPVAGDDSATVNEGAAVTTGNVLTNDADVDSPLTAASITSFTQGANGSVVNNGDGTFTYTHNGSETTSDSFTYTITDDGGLNSTATVHITVNPVNDPPVAQDGSASGNEDTAISGTLVATDVDGPSLTYSLGTQAANGTVAVNPDGSYTYTPAQDFNGTDSFTFTASDGTAGSNAATISLTVNPVNDPPVAQDGSASGNEDTAISGALVATDVDSPSLTYRLGTQATHGTAVINPDGSYSYAPNVDFNGADSFTFTASDGTAGSNAATISLTVNPVNDPPVAQDGSASGSEDTAISGTLVATDVDSPSLNYRLGAQAAHGVVAVNPDGTFTYTPAQNFNGTDSFTFLANDGTADSNIATISLSIAAVNDPPVAQDGSASCTEDTPVSGTLVAADIDSASLTYSLGTQAAHGTAVIDPDGSYSYTPAPDFNGTDSFTFLANDGEADSNIATVNLSIAAVNDPPVAQNGSASGTEDTAISGTLVATDIDSASLTFRLGTQAVHGAVAVNTDGTYTYTPAPDFSGTDSFTFLANDGTVDSNAATISLSIAAVNDLPVAQDGSASGNEDTAIGGTLVATDADGDSLTYRLGTQAAHGVAAVNADGTFTYTPNIDFNGADSFTFVANDGAADSNIATINLRIAAVDDPPHLDLDANDSTAASTYFVTTFAGTAVSISDVDDAISDPDGSTLASASIHLLTPGTGDVLSVNGSLPAGISASAYDPATGILALSGDASLADYQTAIHQVEFSTSGASSVPRIVEVTVNDGTLDSNTAVAVIGFGTQPEPPPATVDPHWMVTREFTIHPAGWSPIIVADFAGDHMSDLLWQSDSTGVLDEWQIVNAAWSRSVDLGAHPGTGWLPSAGDFNGDGTDDIFWFDPASGSTDIWTMANGEWAASTSPGPHPLGFQVAGTGDFDGDGASDVLWFDAQTGAVDIWRITNDQWAGSVNPGPAPAGFSIAATGDVNHDGSDDVIWFNPSSGDVEVWEMQNGQFAGSVTVGPHPGGYTIVGAADFTGDGTSDILWFNAATGDVDLWKMQDSHWAGSVDIGPHPPGWQPVGIGDSDGNGVPDVWWQQGATSKVEAWMLSIH
ncbi:MAG: Ig-like domain-containing protein [Alphaproteobacteria bacterium]